MEGVKEGIIQQSTREVGLFLAISNESFVVLVSVQEGFARINLLHLSNVDELRISPGGSI